MFLSFFLEPRSPQTACSFFFSFENDIWDFCITHWSKKLRRRWRKTSSTMGLKFQDFATLIIFGFLSVFQRKRKPSSILLSTSSVNKNIRCFREGRNCEEKGFQIPFVLDYLKIVSRAAFWKQLPCSERAETCGEKLCVGVSGWDRTQVAVASECAQVSAMPSSQGGQGEVRFAVERLHETLPPHRSIIFWSASHILVGQNQSWQAERWKRTGSLPAGHLEVMAMV